MPLYGAKVIDVRLTNFVQMPSVGTTDTYHGYIEVSLESTESVWGGGNRTREIMSPLIISVNQTATPTANVQACHSGAQEVDRKEICKMVGGLYSPYFQTCKIPNPPVDCAPGFLPVGIIAGQVRCDRIGTFAPCPAGTFLVALGIESSKCQALPVVSGAPAPQSCIAQSVSWKSLRGVCRANLAASHHGSRIGITQSYPGGIKYRLQTGGAISQAHADSKATFTCINGVFHENRGSFCDKQ
jgi:hypothetical protein